MGQDNVPNLRNLKRSTKHWASSGVTEKVQCNNHFMPLQCPRMLQNMRPLNTKHQQGRLLHLGTVTSYLQILDYPVFAILCSAGTPHLTFMQGIRAIFCRPQNDRSAFRLQDDKNKRMNTALR